MRSISLLLIALFISAVGLNATIISVNWDGSGDYLTIQDGIDAANDGDTVLVADGTYTGENNKNLTWDGNEKHIVLKSENGAENCIIDCEDNGRGFNFDGTNQDTTDVINGFTIKDGNIDYTGYPYNAYGAGIYIVNCSLFFQDCIITSNTVTAFYTTPYYYPNVIPVYAFGGGVNCENSQSKFYNCQFINNISNGLFGHEDPMGLTIYCESGYGSGVNLTNSSIQFFDCLFSDNSTNFKGGAICLTNSTTEIKNCIICGNDGGVYGGAVYCDSSNCNITNSLIFDNSTFWRGGAICISYNSNLIIKNSTLYGNEATFSCIADGGGIACLEDSYALVVNSILWNNIPEQIFVVSSSTTDITYSDIEDGWTGTGNISSNPLFYNSSISDYHLTQNSPCINSGTPDTTGLHLPPWDLDGNPRIYDGRIDMGCYEWQGVGIDDWHPYSEDIVLYQNYPNPFSSSTTISFNSATKSHKKARVGIYNIKGQLVRKLGFRISDFGFGEAIWDGKDEKGNSLSSGIYFYRLETDNYKSEIKKMILIK